MVGREHHAAAAPTNANEARKGAERPSERQTAAPAFHWAREQHKQEDPLAASHIYIMMRYA